VPDAVSDRDLLTPQRRRLLLVAIVAAGAALRCIAIGTRLNSDDAYTWVVAHAPSWQAFYDRLIAYENTPPLYYAIARALPAGGEAWLRLPAVIASTACIAVVYAIVRPLLGTRAALLAAAGLAVAPFALAVASLARGFVLAELGLLLVVWAAARLAQGGPRTWWWLYGAGSIVALYSSYASPLVLILVAGVLLLVGTPRRLETVGFAALPVLAFVPWLPSLVRSMDAIDETKVAGVTPDASLDGARVVLNSLVYGRLRFDEQIAGLGAPRALLAVAVLVVAAIVLWRATQRPRIAFALTFGLAAATYAGHWILAAAGQDGVFDPRYLSVATPLLVMGVAGALDAVPWRPLVPAAAAALVLVAVVTAAVRWGNDSNPDMAPVHAAAEARHPRTLLTNTAIVAYYLRDLHPQIDRAFGLSGGGRDCSTGCPRPVVVVDDGAPTAGGVRPGPGRSVPVGRFVVRLVPVDGPRHGG